MVVRLRRRNALHPDLSPKQDYVVLGIEADDYRLLNDAGRPYLYPSRLFEILDPTEPTDWVTDFGEEGERYSYPPALNAPGFFEDFHDGQPQAMAIFWQFINRHCASAVAV